MGRPDTLEAPDYERRIEFDASADAVFEALTDPAGIAGWWMPASGSGAAGGRLSLDFPPGPGVFRVDAAESASLVAWTVLVCDFLPDWVGTRIVFVLRPGERGGTVLEFRHRGLTPELECFDQCRQGWDHYLPSLRDHVDTGTGRPGDRHRPRA